LKILKNSKKYVESRKLHNEDCLCEVGLEIQDNIEVQSISSASRNGRNDKGQDTGRLMEKILHKDNLNEAYKRVKRNKGSHGVDGMTVDELLEYLKRNGCQLRKDLLEESYTPKPVRRVEIDKPDGGKRMLGIPIVVDRVIQQAIAQVLTPIYEGKFSETSYGFRPNRNQHQAIRKCQEYINEGYKWVVDIDISKYFDTVNHDKLMSILARDIADKRVLRLIRKYLQSGVMINGVVADTDLGCPQGGPASPLLSNIYLNELDKELEKRGLRFCRFADDSNIYVKSRRSAERVMKSITKFLEEELKLKINPDKSKVDRPWKLKYLGFSFYYGKDGIQVRVHPKSIEKLKKNIKEVTSRSNGKSLEWRFLKLKEKLQGWINYFRIANMKRLAIELDKWLRRRIRLCIWKQWKRVRTRFKELKRQGISEEKAWEYANTRKGYWRISSSPIMSIAYKDKDLENLGLISITKYYLGKG
jgi:RNA-directed DNA polymerase